MTTHVDRFLEDNRGEIVDWPLRHLLEKYHQFLRDEGVFPADEEEDAAPQMFPAVVVTWTESERGWGCRPDGVSLHLTTADAAAFIKAYWDWMPPRDAEGSPPDEYTRNDNDGSPIQVSRELRDKIAASKKKGITLGNSEWANLQKSGDAVRRISL